MAGGIDKHVIADPKTHYGHASPRAATRNFVAQRLTGVINALLLLFFAWFVLRLAGAGRADMVEVVRNPLVAVLLAILVVNVPVHMRIGMREVIEDYVHDTRLNRFALMLNSFFAICIGLSGLGAIAKIVFWG